MLVLATSFSSCQKYFLDAEPQESVSDASAIVDASTAESALLGVYDKVQSSSYYGGDGYQAAAYLSGGDHLWVGTLNYYNTLMIEKKSAIHYLRYSAFIVVVAFGYLLFANYLLPEKIFVNSLIHL